MAYSSSAREKILFPQRQQLPVVLVQQSSDWMPSRATFSTPFLEAAAVTSSADLSMARGDPNRPPHTRLFRHKVAQTGASLASHSAPLQHLPRLQAFLAWTTQRLMAICHQGQSQEHVDYSLGVNPRRDQEASQKPPPNVGLRDRDLCRVRFQESKAQQSMRRTMPVRWFQKNVIWMSRNGILRCAWN